MAEDYERFGSYRVHECIGAGGMATVHRATLELEDGDEVEVALKRLLPQLAGDRRLVDDFIREARLASQLVHPNIARILEAGRNGKTYFIAMELVRGASLVALLRLVHVHKVKTPIGVVLALAIELCDALEHAHELHIVHRDLSPSNLLVTEDGHLKVIDFGVAKALAGQLQTNSGLAKGKLGYMSVEAIGGKHVDLRADIFSTGVVLWELLSGRRLFRGNNEIEVIVQIQRGVVPPASTYHDDCPVELDRVIARALARDPDERFASAGELRDELCDLRRYYEDDAHEGAVVDWIATLRAGAVAQRRVDTSEEATELHLADDDLVEVPPALAEGSRRAEPYDVDIEIEPPRVAPEPRNPRFIESDTVINEDTLDSDDH